MKIKSLKLYTTHLEDLKQFYGELLGFHIINNNSDAFTLRCGRTNLSFSSWSKPGNPNYHFAFNIPENQIAEVKAWLDNRVQLLSHEGKTEIDFSNWNAKALFFFDPGGNIVEFIARHDLKNASNKPFSADAITSVSEIGLPVSNLKNWKKIIDQSLKLPVYNASSESFIPFGDEYGLFISVPIGRAWFPVDVKADSYDIEIELEMNDFPTLKFENYVIRSN